MSNWIAPIYDRTLNDVNNAIEQIRAWKERILKGESVTTTDLKGSFGINDLNRVEGNMDYVIKKLVSLGYGDLTTYKPRVAGEWLRSDVCNIEELERITNNLILLKSMITQHPQTPDTPDIVSDVDYLKANDLEKIIFDINRTIECMTSYYVRAGVSRSGQARFWQNRFRR